MEDKMRALVLGVTTLALSAGAALAQAPAQDVYPSSGYAQYGYGYAPYGYGYTSYGYGYAAPLYDYAGYGYAAPAIAAPATARTTVIIVTPGSGYSAPVVGSGYYNYAPGYWGGYGYGWR
jgi:hypothetical protein